MRPVRHIYDWFLCRYSSFASHFKCLFAFSSRASLSNSAGRLLLLNQLLTLTTESACKTMLWVFGFFFKALHIEMSCQHFCTSCLSQQTGTLTDYCPAFSSDGNKSSHHLLFRRRRRERFSEGRAFTNATLGLSRSLAASCVPASTPLVAIVTQRVFDQSLLRIGPAKWKTLKQVMFEKSFFSSWCCLPVSWNHGDCWHAKMPNKGDFRFHANALLVHDDASFSFFNFIFFLWQKL